MQKAEVNSVLASFNERTEAVGALRFVARDTGLQLQAIDDLADLNQQIDTARRKAADDADERAANFLLGLQCAVQGLTAELRVYVLLKQEKSEEAWNALIDAQDAYSAAMRADGQLGHLEASARRARELEFYLFPPQVFLSAGMIVRTQICSICKEDYSACGHLAGLPYCGRFCTVELRDIEPDHVAFVEEPANRRCRVTSFSVPGGTRNRMTWVITPSEEAREPSEGLEAEGIIATAPKEEPGAA